MSKIISNYIDGDYKVTEYGNGTVVRSLISELTTTEPQPTSNNPTNSEIAQMISDLQADLIIAGVI